MDLRYFTQNYSKQLLTRKVRILADEVWKEAKLQERNKNPDLARDLKILGTELHELARKHENN